MRTMIAVLALVGVIGATAVEVAAQEERSFINFRVCEILPGQQAAAQSLAREFVDLSRAKFPGAVVNGWTHVLAPNDHMHFLIVVPDLATYQSYLEALGADPAYGALVQKAYGGILTGCTDELLRAVSPAG